MNIREYISVKNLSGVQDYAMSRGLNVPRNSQEAFILLTDIYNSDMNFAKELFKKLHPDLFLFTNPQVDSTKRNSCGCGDEKRNACGCGCGGNCGGNTHRNADGLDNAINRVESAGKDTLKDIKEAIKDRDDRLLKYGLVLITGILVGKYLIK